MSIIATIAGFAAFRAIPKTLQIPVLSFSCFQELAGLSALIRGGKQTRARFLAMSHFEFRLPTLSRHSQLARKRCGKPTLEGKDIGVRLPGAICAYSSPRRFQNSIPSPRRFISRSRESTRARRGFCTA